MEEPISEVETIASNKELMEAFAGQNWKDLWMILQAHTVHRLKYRYGVKEKKDVIISWSREIISSALNLIIVERTRRWNTTAYPEFRNFILSVIDGHLWNSFKTKAKEVPTEEDTLATEINSRGTSSNIQNDLATEELGKEIRSELSALGADDEEMLVFECLFDGIYQPDAIKKELGIDDQNFANIWRRVRRKREKLKSKFSKYVC